MEVYVIRHTEVAVDKSVCYGQTDVPLASTYATDLAALQLKLPRDFDAVFSSPLKRCTQLATDLGKGEIIKDSRLLEVNFGAWETKTWDSINQDELNTWMSDFVHAKPPEGENLLELNTRVEDFLDELKNTSLKKVLIVAHAGVIRCIWAYMVQVPLANIFKIPISFGEVLILQLAKDFEQSSIKQKS
jgi:alpha-ribazole phosphatase